MLAMELASNVLRGPGGACRTFQAAFLLFSASHEFLYSEHVVGGVCLLNSQMMPFEHPWVQRKNIMRRFFENTGV